MRQELFSWIFAIFMFNQNAQAYKINGEKFEAVYSA